MYRPWITLDEFIELSVGTNYKLSYALLVARRIGYVFTYREFVELWRAQETLRSQKTA